MYPTAGVCKEHNNYYITSINSFDSTSESEGTQKYQTMVASIQNRI